MTLRLEEEEETCVFRGKMPWDEGGKVMVSGCDDEGFMLSIVSSVYGEIELMVKHGEVIQDQDGVSADMEDIFSDEKPRTSRFLNLFSDTEEEHDNLKNLLDDIFESI